MAIQKRERAQAVALNERLFRLDARAQPVLLGARCPECGARFFPRRAICAGCGHLGLEQAELAQTGTVWSYTVVRQAPPGAIVEAPYVVAQVELPDKVLIQSLITECGPDEASVGLEVEIVPVKVREDEEGRDVLAFAFRPRKAGKGGKP